MERQLALLEVNDKEWKLDERTREVGKQGVEQAREALRRAMREQHHPNAA
ncbi:MAG: hypothetical protein ACRDJP_04160 [Actinomycetota bacterium]